MEYQSLSREQLSEKLAALNEKYNGYKALGLALNMARGKPGADQLDLTNEMMNAEYLGNYITADGT